MIFKKLIKFITNTVVFYFREFLNIFNERAIYIFLKSLRKSSLMNKRSNLLTEFKIYSKNPQKLFPVHSNTDNVSIIIQGPIFDRDFLQASIDWYYSCGIKNIVVSTSNDIKSFKNCTTVVSKIPFQKGIWNENIHLMTIKNALQNIDDNCLVIKTRSDQRIYNELALTSIKSFHKSQISNNTFDNSRLGVVSNNSMMIKINNISDHLYIGNCNLLKKMFDIKIRNKEKLFKDFNLNDFKLKILRDKLKSSFYTELEAEQWFFNSFRKNCLMHNSAEEILINKKN